MRGLAAQQHGTVALPGDLCYVLSYPAVECCVVIEQLERRSWPLTMWTESNARTHGWTGTALCITTLAVEERDGLCSCRCACVPCRCCSSACARGKAKIFCRRGGRPLDGEMAGLPSGQRLPAGRQSTKFRRKIIFCRALGASDVRSPTAAHRWWQPCARGPSSFTAIRQKKLG